MSFMKTLLQEGNRNGQIMLSLFATHHARSAMHVVIIGHDVTDGVKQANKPP
jgi:hypothetical protein